MTEHREFGWAQAVAFGQGVSFVQRRVAHAFGMTVEELLESGRSQHQAVLARQVAVWIARRATKASYPELGRAFGRDHTTMMASERAVGRLIATDAKLRGLVIDLWCDIDPPESGTVCSGGEVLAKCARERLREVG
jgi:hypothetical protein